MAQVLYVVCAHLRYRNIESTDNKLPRSIWNIEDNKSTKAEKFDDSLGTACVARTIFKFHIE